MSDELNQAAQAFRNMIRVHRCRLNHVLSDQGLHMGQPAILFALQGNPRATQRELADILHISSATMTTSLQRMERAGLVTRACDPRDTRRNCISITEKGQQVAEASKAAFWKVDLAVFKDFSPEEIENAQKLFERISRNLSSNGNQE